MSKPSHKEMLEAIMRMPVYLIRRSMENPSKCMTRGDILLHAVALRRKGEVDYA